MFTIRKEQLAILEKKEIEKFGERMVAHLRKVFPERSEVLGDNGLRDLIRYGVLRSASYRIVAERDVCKYIDLMMVFGRDFDQSRQYSWAAAILNAKKGPARKMKVLFKTAKTHEKEQTA
jgi:hypothetical protein